jgi:hypothetical protein
VTATFPSTQSPLFDVQWRGWGQLNLLGMSFTSLKEQVDSEVGSAEFTGRVLGVTGCWSRADPNLFCLHRDDSNCLRRPRDSQTHCAGDSWALLPLGPVLVHGLTL